MALNFLRKSLLLFNTVKYLKARQVVWRIVYLLPRVKRSYATATELNKDIPTEQFLFKTGITSDFNHFTFLNETHSLKKVGWQPDSISKLWRYNLHYFDYLSEDSKLSQGQAAIIQNWIDENPIGTGTGWEPYPTSLRIINWIKWYWQTGELNRNAIRSLWNQVNWLNARPEFHLLGNHLFVNAKALLFACAVFQLGESSPIYKKACKILDRELDEQFLDDGGHFELSPMYHSLALEDLLDLYNIVKLLPGNFAVEKIRERIRKGMDWLRYMSYENGELSHFNDSANGIAPSYEVLAAYAKRLKIDINNFDSKNFKFLRESGFVVFMKDGLHLIFDCGNIGADYIPGHAHADTLSFELTIKGQRLIVNSGTSEYGTSRERLRQRSTSAHSTVEIDGQSSSEVWSGFRVGRRARITDLFSSIESNRLVFGASHDGYRRLGGKPIHRRQFDITDSLIQIEDSVSGISNVVISRFHLHPAINATLNDSTVSLVFNNKVIAIIRSCGNGKVELQESTYHDQFGISQRSQSIIIRGKAPATFSTELQLLN